MNTVKHKLTTLALATATLFLCGFAFSQPDITPDQPAPPAEPAAPAPPAAPAAPPAPTSTSPGGSASGNGYAYGYSTGGNGVTAANISEGDEGDANIMVVRDNESPKEVAWLGLAVGECSEALSAQLGLKPGQGLTVAYVVHDSPAAKAGFQKHDVLDELDGQMLVGSEQFRKLIHMHAAGDSINISYFRGGKKMTASVKLDKTTVQEGGDYDSAQGVRSFKLQMDRLKDHFHDASSEFAKVERDQTQREKDQLDKNVRRAVEQARRAMEEAMREESNAGRNLTHLNSELKELGHTSVDMDNDTTITIRKNGSSNKTIVRSDEDGTIVIEGGDKMHLTATDKEGKTLFDGDISTSADRKKVPREVWSKAKPMVEQLQ